jgi:hypothetical protein
MRPDSKFDGDDLRRTDPKFQQPRFSQYLAAVARLYKLAQQRFRKHVIISRSAGCSIKASPPRCGVHATPASCSRSAR